MWQKKVIFLIAILVFSGCSGKKPESYYAWKTYNTIIHNKVLSLSSEKNKVIKVREIKYFAIGKKNMKDGSLLTSEKEYKYIYLNPAQKLDIYKDDYFYDESKTYEHAILFSSKARCKNENRICSFRELRLSPEVLINGKRSHKLTRSFVLSKPIRMTSESTMRDKVYNYLSNK